MYDIFDTNYFDSTLVTFSLIKLYGEKHIYNVLNNLLKSNKTRYISLSNSNLLTIKNVKKEFGDKFFAHEAHLSFEIRECQDVGIFDLCNEIGVRNIIWRPLRENKTVDHNWPILAKLSKKYNKTQNQIVLNWMTHFNFMPMVMSKNILHIQENIESVNFKMEESEYQEINKYRVPNYNHPKVDWDKTGDGISVSLLPAQFEFNLIKI